MSSFDIQRYLQERKIWIDCALDRYLEQKRKLPRRLLEAMRYGVLSEGKRLRPILTLAAGEIFGAPRKSLLPFACAIEMIHAYSLIHDDLPALDDDEFRRGELANHKVYGEGMALLAGDALLAEAFQLLARAEVARVIEPRRILKLIHEIAHAAGVDGLAGGQALDLESEGRRVSVARLEAVHRHKTGALIVAAVRVGARIGGASADELRHLTRYGQALGLAFQIADDLLDAADLGTGKNGHAGSAKDKATYPSLVGLAAARSRARDLARQCLRHIEPFGAAAEPLRGIALYVVERKM
ncbi:MAG: polyprenyl synthetase family protein [Candidatus Binatia bacterium]